MMLACVLEQDFILVDGKNGVVKYPKLSINDGISAIYSGGYKNGEAVKQLSSNDCWVCVQTCKLKVTGHIIGLNF